MYLGAAECIVLTDHNGSGKSSAAKILAALLFHRAEKLPHGALLVI